MRILTCALLLVVTSALPTFGQDFGLTLGAGRTWDDEGSVGGGGLFGAAASFAIATEGRLMLTINAERLSHDRTTSNGGLRFKGRTWLTAGNLAWRFGGGVARPYVFGGAGMVFYDGTFEDATAGTFVSRDSTSTTLLFGTGVEIAAARHFVIKPEFRVYMAQPEDDFAPWSIARGAVTVSWRR